MLNKINYYISKFIKKLHIPAIKNSKIHKTSKIASASHIVDTTINKYTYVGNNCTVVDTEIGSFCSIADNVTIGGASHPVHWVSTSPVFHMGRNILKKNFSNHAFQTNSLTIIKNDIWIGSNCLIKSGITIENGAIIGMGSVLTKNVGPYEIWAGNPAKIIKKRFDDTTIENLLKIKWWGLDDNNITRISSSMHKTSKFIEQYKNKGD